MKTEYIKTSNNTIVGIIEIDGSGNQTVRDYISRQILGYYKKSLDATTDFYGKIIAKGNMASALIYKEYPEKFK